MSRNFKGIIKSAHITKFRKMIDLEFEVRVQYKDWYKSQKEYWGRGSSKAYARWKSDNNEQVLEFLDNFRKAYNYLAKKKNLPTI